MGVTMPLEGAVLVHHHRHEHRRGLELFEQAQDRQRLGDVERLAQHLVDLSPASSHTVSTRGIMIDSSRTMPTAVMTLSSENTASSTTICTITCQNTAWTGLAFPASSPPSGRSCNSVVPLNKRNRPPTMRMTSRQEISLPSMVNSG